MFLSVFEGKNDCLLLWKAGDDANSTMVGKIGGKSYSVDSIVLSCSSFYDLFEKYNIPFNDIRENVVKNGCISWMEYFM